MDGAGRFIAGERGAFDVNEPSPKPEPRVRHAATCPLWQTARIDSQSFEQLADICGCTPDEFNERYE